MANIYSSTWRDDDTWWHLTFTCSTFEFLLEMKCRYCIMIVFCSDEWCGPLAFRMLQDVSLSRAEENNLKRAILQRATVVCGTLSAFGQHFISDLLRHSAGRGKPVFDCVIVDEVRYSLFCRLFIGKSWRSCIFLCGKRTHGSKLTDKWRDSQWWMDKHRPNFSTMSLIPFILIVIKCVNELHVYSIVKFNMSSSFSFMITDIGFPGKWTRLHHPPTVPSEQVDFGRGSRTASPYHHISGEWVYVILDFCFLFTFIYLWWMYFTSIHLLLFKHVHVMVVFLAQLNWKSSYRLNCKCTLIQVVWDF